MDDITFKKKRPVVLNKSCWIITFLEFGRLRSLKPAQKKEEWRSVSSVLSGKWFILDHRHLTYHQKWMPHVNHLSFFPSKLVQIVSFTPVVGHDKAIASK